MLFGSGYKKRHFIRCLQQLPLSGGQMARIDRLIRRAVTEGTGVEGTGVEENRAWRKLAAHVIVQGHLPGLNLWLEQMAQSAQVRSRDMPQQLIWQRLARVGEVKWTEWFGWKSEVALRYPALDTMIKADPAPTALAPHRLGPPIGVPVSDGH